VKIVVLLLLTAQMCWAQNQWHTGVVVLPDQQVRTGQMTLHADVLIFRSNEQVTVYSPHQIASFRFFDQKENINRQYLSVSDRNSIYPIHRFYEIVTKGNISVVRRNNYPLLTSVDDKDYSYFSLRHNELIPLKRFRSRVFPELLHHLPFQLNDYITQQNLNPNRMADAIQIVQFYNRQIQTEISIVGL
jgi:hypothetical protein